MKQNKFMRYTVGVCLTLTFCFVALMGVYDYILPDHISCRAGEAVAAGPAIVLSAEAESTPAFAGECSVQRTQASLFGLPLKTVNLVNYEDLRLYPGGMPFGVKLYTEGILVVGFDDIDSADGAVNPAYDAGLRIKDLITHLNGQPMTGVDALTAFIENGGGEPITVTYVRGNTQHTTTVTPVRSASDNKFKTGMWVRDSGAGIGTVTFIHPTTGEFGGLGHGICDADTGELMPMQRGTVMDVSIDGVVRGTPGVPGELRGSFRGTKSGALIRNTACGVYGVLSSLPEALPCEPLPIALKDEIHAGEATIRCTLDAEGPAEYTVELSAINKNADGSKCFVVKVTDPGLIEKTGGIVQGMSGSPIIQDGKLVGAVTHVLINDPTRGYGIFIENMLVNLPLMAS